METVADTAGNPKAFCNDHLSEIFWDLLREQIPQILRYVIYLICFTISLVCIYWKGESTVLLQS